jgi:hypothetical protein
MPAIIDSAPDCIVHIKGARPADDSADFILQASYLKCGANGGQLMTFGPGSTFGDGGAAATTSYYVLTYVGIIVTLIVIVAWVLYENRRLLSHAARLSLPGRGGVAPPPVQPGTTSAEEV